MSTEVMSAIPQNLSTSPEPMSSPEVATFYADAVLFDMVCTSLFVLPDLC